MTASSWLDDIPAQLAALDAAHLTRRRRQVRPAGGAWLWVDGRRIYRVERLGARMVDNRV